MARGLRLVMGVVASFALSSAGLAQSGAGLGGGVAPVGVGGVSGIGNVPARTGGGLAGLAANAPAAVAAAPAPVSGTLVRPRRENPVVSIQEFVRLEGRMPNVLHGIGIVTGLKGTGDAGTDLVLARPLAEVYKNNGNPLADLKDLAKAKSAAIVTLSATIQEGGGREGDQIDVFVQVSHSATSLKGGTLILSPLLGGRVDRPLLFAMASGPITIEDAEVPTSGMIRMGATLTRDVWPVAVGESFNLVLRPVYRSFQMARTIASEVNDLVANLDSDEPSEAIATALDDMTIRVTIPKQERGNPTSFLANVMGKKFSPSLIDLPAMVVVNERTGSIVVTGDVEISAVTVGSEKLVITTTTPAPVPSATDPIVSHQNWTEFGTTGSGADRARIQDLLEAFKQLNVPVKEQIGLLAQIYQTGRLHARFVRE